MSKDTKSEYVYSLVNQKIKESEKDTDDEVYTDTGPVLGIRHLQIFIYFVLGLVAYGFKVILSVGIVAMTDSSISSNPDIPTYQWKEKNAILSAFLWGYALPQVFASYIAKKYGAKWLLVGTTFFQSILIILMPVTAATFGAKGLMFSRALQGFCQGFMLPSLTHLLSQWAPPQERSRLGSLVFAAGNAGIVAATLITGLLAASWYGWPLAFYVYGGIGFLWCVMMSLFGFDSPRENPMISQAERLYIEKSLGHTDKKSYKTPWKALVTSVPVWALFAVQIGNSFCFWTLLTQIPTYMNYVVRFDIKSNSFWSSMPYLTFWILCFLFGAASDAIINKRIVSRSATRKIFIFIGLLIPAAALIALGFTNSNQRSQAVALLIVAVGFNSACFTSLVVNHMDMSPNHAAALCGLTNGFAQIPGMISPLVVQLLVTNEKDPLQWRYVFFLTAGANVIVCIIYAFFGSGKRQPWNKIEDEENT